MKQKIVVEIMVPAGNKCYRYDEGVDCWYRGNRYCKLYDKPNEFDAFEKLDECENGAPIDAVWIPK